MGATSRACSAGPSARPWASPFLFVCVHVWLLALLVLAASAAPAFDADRAYRDLQTQCSFGPRAPGTPAHEECAEWLVAQLRQCTNSVVNQPSTQRVGGAEVRLTNIIATLNPKGARPVLLCAHWDTRPRAEEDPDPAQRQQPILGANDGASGVAVLLEVARTLRAQHLSQRVILVLFDGEDYGTTVDTMFLGSRYYAEHARGAPPVWAALLDMVGDKDLRIPVEAYSQQQAPEVVDRLWEAARRAGAPAFVRARGPAILDDHLPLLKRGIPCVDIIDFTYPFWHTTADRPDKCSAESLGQVGRTLLTAIREGERGAGDAPARMR